MDISKIMNNFWPWSKFERDAELLRRAHEANKQLAERTACIVIDRPGTVLRDLRIEDGRVIYVGAEHVLVANCHFIQPNPQPPHRSDGGGG